MSGGRRSRAGEPCKCCGVIMTLRRAHRSRRSSDHAGHGYCWRDYRRWMDAGFPPGGPPEPSKGGSKGGTIATRLEDYHFLRGQGLRPIQIAARCNVTVTTVYRWAAAAREQAA